MLDARADAIAVPSWRRRLGTGLLFILATAVLVALVPSDGLTHDATGGRRLSSSPPFASSAPRHVHPWAQRLHTHAAEPRSTVAREAAARAAATPVEDAPLVGTCSQPRNIFIDAGVNWCNTIRLFEDIEYGKNATFATALPAPYDVYGLEASPLIQPFAEQYFRWLNGLLDDEPETCLPRSGSTAHLKKYSSVYGCLHADANRMRQCMWQKLTKHLNALRPDPRLNSSTLIAERLDGARQQCGPPPQNRFTFLPAAAGHSGDNAWLEFYGPPQQLVRGGSIPKQFAPPSLKDGRYDFRVRVVNLPLWLAASFTTSDHVVLKMDVEGSEHGILEEMVGRGIMGLIDVLSLECHGSGGNCENLIARVRQAHPRIRLLKEGWDHSGYDSHSTLNSDEQAAVAKACEAFDPARFTLSHRPTGPATTPGPAALP